MAKQLTHPKRQSSKQNIHFTPTPWRTTAHCPTSIIQTLIIWIGTRAMGEWQQTIEEPAVPLHGRTWVYFLKWRCSWRYSQTSTRYIHSSWFVYCVKCKQVCKKKHWNSIIKPVSFGDLECPMFPHAIQALNNCSSIPDHPTLNYLNVFAQSLLAKFR